MEIDSIAKSLGKIDIAKNQLHSKTSMEEAQATILELKQFDIIQINDWIVDPSL